MRIGVRTFAFLRLREECERDGGGRKEEGSRAGRETRVGEEDRRKKGGGWRERWREAEESRNEKVNRLCP